MSLTTLLSVAIALSFAYFLLSSLASAINEAIGAILKNRPKGLEQAILTLVGGDKGDPQLGQIAQRVYDHSLVSGLSSIAKPSYVPARNFTHAVIDVLVKGADGSVLSSIRQAIADLPPEHPLTQALRSAATAAGEDVEAFRVLVDKWFDDAMDRLSGVYKRNTQILLFGLGLGLAVAFNVDTLHMVGSLLSDKPALANAVAAATQTTETIAKANSSATGSVGTAGGTEENNLKDAITQSQRNVLDAADRLIEASLPIGWHACPAKPDKSQGGVLCLGWYNTSASPHYDLLVAVLGWFVTALAVSFGAPFWFDLLNSFVNIRAAGPKPKATNKDDA